jgi:hypothetical protein
MPNKFENLSYDHYSLRWARTVRAEEEERFEEYDDGFSSAEDFERYESDNEDESMLDDDAYCARVFANKGSALRASSPSNPRNLPCPTCGKPDRLTPADRARGYQCDECADSLEMGGY